MKIRLALAAAIVSLGLVSGCAEHRHVVYEEPLPTPPPPVGGQVVLPQPGPNYVWVDGYWSWDGRWLWIPGQWMARPYPDAVYIPGYWARRGYHMVWVQEHWRKG